tara:strand:+ start:8693 stop:10156 length:1464 start_codon:yes stop_codon:yes gene_type:complete
MSKELFNLKPEALWRNFAALNAVPRPSKKEERVIAFMQDFGKKLGLETITDEVGNVLIKKPASQGMEDRKKIVLQSHLDMVHQKNNATVFDFDKEGIKMFVDGDWVKADGTTLGADNGIGAATMMALLESKEIAHPAIEALFTIDEETGMTGAFGLKPGFLEGEILLNLDTEDDDELTIGCAGGVNVTITAKYDLIDLPANFVAYKLTLKGLSGGHSGMDINKGLGNANKLANRLIYLVSEKMDVGIQSFHGGSLRNAIPREAELNLAIPRESKDLFQKIINQAKEEIIAEHVDSDPNLALIVEPTSSAKKMTNPAFTRSLSQALYALPNGIYRMSPSIPDMVQTSNNLAQIEMEEGTLRCLCLCRSSVDSEKEDEVRAIISAFAGIACEIETDGDYPGWTPRTQSDIVELMSALYREKFESEPRVMACHAGLECGIIGSNYPKMDIVSFGPTIRGAHSPDEKVQISSVQKYWGFLLETLKRIPKRT